MPVYLVMLAAVIAAGIPLCSKKAGKAGRIIFCIAAALMFTFVSAVRFKVGYDYNLYGGLYFNMKYLEWVDIPSLDQEKGFLIPFYILNLANEEYYHAFIFTSILFYPVIFYFIYRYSKHPWLSTTAFLCFGIFFNSLCFLRQFLAAMIILYAMKFIEGKNPLRFFVLTIIASAFHWSALIWLVLYFLVKIKPGWIYLGIIAAGTTIFCFISRKLMYWLVDNFEMYSLYNPDTNLEASQGLSPWFSVMFAVIFVIAFLFRKRLADKNPANMIYLNCLMYTVVFEVMGTRHAILSRFALLVYLTPVLYMIPDIFDSVREYIDEKISGRDKLKPVRTITAVFAAMFSAACYILLIQNNYNGVNPYVSQFHKTEELFVEYTDKPAVTTTAVIDSPVTTTAGESGDTTSSATTKQEPVETNDPADNPAELEEDILNALEQLG